MTRDPQLPRRYDDAEVARILKRATEIRKEGSLTASSAPDEGLTLQELEEIAAEAGIDVAHLRRAAMEVDTGTDRPGPLDRVVGGPLTLVHEEVVEGEVDEEGFQVLLETLQRGLGEFGLPSLMGRTLTWKNEATKSGGRSTMATVAVRDGRTTIRIEESYQQVAAGLQGGVTVGGGIGVGVGVGVPLATTAGSLLLGIAFPVGALAVAYVIARASYRGYVGKRGRKVSDVLASMVEAARHEIGGPSTETRSRLPREDDPPRLSGGAAEDGPSGSLL